jgi:hypothetical protein
VPDSSDELPKARWLSVARVCVQSGQTALSEGGEGKRRSQVRGQCSLMLLLPAMVVSSFRWAAQMLSPTLSRKSSGSRKSSSLAMSRTYTEDVDHGQKDRRKQVCMVDAARVPVPAPVGPAKPSRHDAGKERSASHARSLLTYAHRGRPKVSTSR